MFELPLQLDEGVVLEGNQLLESLALRLVLDHLCENVEVVHGTQSNLVGDLCHLVLIKNVFEAFGNCLLIVSCKLKCREHEFRLLHIVINSLIEVLAHVSFENDWEVISEPLALRAGIQP